ncbi:MAG: tRNA (adenosine(37)-N6)-threonylcarbamoyltransferase complex dimerization subunit type 1 TsaB [Micavibrio aeruginosavorus]|uniref:tRNA (Adenosine(37)-N6)-threonylcarbamoyltransferase complex dimerization subunit type 1 TsaB n=1 Tax=Micavibrio aeruginosavorus TaxID=349221 RepID=A0A2W4ZZR9_9BACT|nr:MAG: tRNA (adenosine(37)-N6)-threonylcarbamoyltransferase complex dimerization subunit type 1 TsaB [Micavibrio aeruginosavorus]
MAILRACSRVPRVSISMMSAKSSNDQKGLVLSIDAAMGGCVAGLYNPVTGEAVERSLRTEREQAAKLVPMVQEMIAEAGAGFPDVALIVTTIGPGSFTGLRIGMSAARSFALALGIPLQGITTFDAVLESCARGEDGAGYFILLEAKRRDFYVQVFDKNKTAGEPVCLETPEIVDLARGKGLILCGDAAGRLAGEAGEAFDGLFSEVRECILPFGAVIARKGHDVFTKNGHVADKAEPLYMRGADVFLSSKTQRKIADFPV